MPEPTFRGDPYAVLGVSHDSSDVVIKRRWRALAREHHPDRATTSASETKRLTARMARINAAYDLLRDRDRRTRFDASPAARRARDAEASGGHGRPSGLDEAGDRDWTGAGGPPPPPQTRPVTARFDTTAAFHRRNAKSKDEPTLLSGHPPAARRYDDSDLRASTPTGPVRRRPSGLQAKWPSLQEARSTPLEFGRFHGHTLGEVADHEPTYIDWIAHTITRDRDVVMGARVIQADLDERGVPRSMRPSRPGFGNPRDLGDEAQTKVGTR